MDTEANDIEAYAKGIHPGDIISLLSKDMGAARLGSASDDALQIHEFGHARVILQPSEDGFLSVRIRGSAPWRSCAALGRHISSALHCVVRCDPGSEFPRISPRSNLFLEIDRGAESIVPWG